MSVDIFVKTIAAIIAVKNAPDWSSAEEVLPRCYMTQEAPGANERQFRMTRLISDTLWEPHAQKKSRLNTCDDRSVLYFTKWHPEHMENSTSAQVLMILEKTSEPIGWR